MASFAVDVFTADVVRSLCSGGRLVMASYDDLLTPPSLCELLINEKIEFAEFVPHVLGHVIDHLEATSQTLSDLSVLIIGSDVWLGSEWARAHRVCGAQARMINAYGLNETSVDCTYFEDTIDDEPPRGYVPIGKPFLNHRIYILDTEGRPVPTGVPGELHIGGPGVVRGYWNRPDITAERFLPDPFSEIAGARMLKTGDRVRMHPDGNMEVLGRVDDQVKVRAFRVELGEIECVLLDHPDIRQAAVVVREDEQGERQLVAYLVADAPLSTPDIRRYLVELLPTYMVPSMVLQLDELPLTANRLKVDRAALPTPDWSARTSDDGFVAPSTEMECQLAQMWLDVLPVDRVGVHDNFMDLGGHSLLLIPVLARIEKDFGVRLVPGELVLATLGQLVATVEQHQAQPQEVGRRSLLSRVFRRH